MGVDKFRFFIDMNVAERINWANDNNWHFLRDKEKINRKYSQIDNWCKENLTGSYANFIGHSFIESKENAVLFILRWNYG